MLIGRTHVSVKPPLVCYDDTSPDGRGSVCYSFEYKKRACKWTALNL